MLRRKAGSRAAQRQCGQAAGEPRRATDAPATDRGDANARGHRVSCCRATMTVIGEDTSERLDVIPAQFRGDRDQTSETCLPDLRWYRGASTGTATADRRRFADRGDGGPCAGGPA